MRTNTTITDNAAAVTRRRITSIIFSAAALLVVASAAIAFAPRGDRAAAGNADQTQARRIEVLFLGHASTHHNSGLFAPMLKSALAPEGFNISYTENLDDLNPKNLALYDALMVYGNQTRISPEQEKALLDWVASGKGFLPIHSASFMFQNSEAYISLVGAQFSRHGTGTFTAEFTQPSHEILRDLQPFEAWDETYVHTKHNTDRTVIMERVDASGREPWTWVRTHGRGRVFYTASGHDERVWNHPMFHKMMRNAILWSVDQQARQAWERLNIQPLQYTKTDVPVPNYERRDPAPLFQEPLTVQEGLKHMQVPAGFELSVFASEPDIVNPIAMTWDERGRLWVVETVDYPNERVDDGQGNDRISIIEDTNNDGHGDKFSVFAERLSIPTGIVLTDGGAMISQAPNFLFLKDTTGDDRADVREVRITGWGTNDTHAGPSNLKYGFDNWLWGSVGYSGFRGTVEGRELRMSQAIYRFTADGQKIEHIANFSNNTWGLGFSEAFDVFGSTANNEHAVFVGIPRTMYEGVTGLRGDGKKKIDGHYPMHANTRLIRQVDSQGGFTAAAGFNLYTARAFPQDFWNSVALVNEPTGHLMHKAILERRGAGFIERDGWNLIASDDEWVAPVHAEVGPDGAVWVLDWYNFIAQHNPTPGGAAVAQGYNFQTGRAGAYETPLRHDRRGRIYRLRWKEAAPYTPVQLSADRPAQLVETLKHDNMFWRMTAQRLLVQRGQTDVLPQVMEVARDRSMDAIGLNGGVVHALWTMHGLGALNGSNAAALEVARGALTHPSYAVRKNAQMVLPNTQQQLQDRLGAAGINDPDASVKLASLLALAKSPPSAPAGRALYVLSKNSEVMSDEWLAEAMYIAAARHSAGFIAAYAEEIGAEEFARVAVMAARGDLPTFTDMSAPEFNDANWRNVQVPAFWNTTPLGTLEGSVWFRRVVDLPAEAAAKGARLRIGRVDDIDVTFVNGKRIGTRTGFNTVREYMVPDSILVAGRNVVAIRVTNNSGRGGIQADSLGIFLSGDGFQADLGGNWRHMIEERWQGRRPDVAASVPLAQQLLRGGHNPVASLVARDTAGASGVNYGDFMGGRGGARGGGARGGGARAGGAGAAAAGAGATGATGATGAAGRGAAGAAGTGGRSGAAGAGATRGTGAAATPPATAGGALPLLEVALSVVPLQNKYDKPTLTARAGQPVRITFRNADDMQHNVVLIQRNSAEAFERELDAMLRDPQGAMSRGFIPDSRLILEQMPLVPGTQTGVLEFTAPTTPGDYPFVCTFPGHWLTMKGVLRVQ